MAMIVLTYSDGKWGYDPIDNANNSVAQLALAGQNTRTTTRLTTDFILEQKLDFLLKGLSAKASISWDNVFYEQNRGVNAGGTALYKYINPDTGIPSYNPAVGSQDFDPREQVAWTVEGGSVDNGATERHLYYSAQLDYNNTFGKHTVGAMGLFTLLLRIQRRVQRFREVQPRKPFRLLQFGRHRMDDQRGKVYEET